MTELHLYIILVLHTRVDDFVVIDESIVRVAVGRSRGARRRPSAGQRFVLLVVQSVDEEVHLDGLHGRLYTYPGGTVGPGDLGPDLGRFAQDHSIIRPDSCFVLDCG